ncbi:FAD dependent oxidoreductase [Stachybotrys elegans]|uniref:FAD dependent oxidoreductase n=1 Tax=Stachybotrys elegans TaxID=80388 RepID=A0A8K0WNT8_9HYPO|nr:FAD dependent oxidoreductase [Stachybotrys elegans]
MADMDRSGLPVDNPTKSYWLRDPSKILLGHRTTEDLPQSADVVIVGSGITGAFAAHCLKEIAPELNIMILEAREACSGATGRNGGHCQPAYYNCPPHIAAFEHQTYSYMKELVESLSIPCDWHVTTGVHGFYSLELFNTSKKVIEKIQKNHPDIGAHIAVVTEERELGSLRVSPAEGAVVQQNAGSLSPYKLVAFLLERLVEAGLNLQTNTPVTSLRSSPGTGWTVSTPRGDVSARHVLLATNAYTSHLLPQFADIIVPVKGQVSSLKPRSGLDIGHTFYFASDLEVRRDDYLIQTPNGELIYGGGRIRADGHGLGNWDDSTIDVEVAQYLRDELGGLMNLSIDLQKQDLQKQLEPTFEWAGIMGFSRDGWPWVGAVPESAGGGDGLWLCAAYTGGGMPNAALCAKAVASMMVGKGVDLPPEYILTEDRLATARTGETIAEADKRAAFMLDLSD